MKFKFYILHEVERTWNLYNEGYDTSIQPVIVIKTWESLIKHIKENYHIGDYELREIEDFKMCTDVSARYGISRCVDLEIGVVEVIM